jgi:hypothetical protein
MDISADNAASKWPCAWHASGGRRRRSAAALAVILALVLAQAAAAKVPLPRPRPADAPRTESPAGQAAPAAEEAPAAPQAGAEDTKAPELSACRLALTESVAIAPSIPPIKGPGGCGGEDLVRLEAVVLSSGQRVAVKPPAVLRCPMAAAVADWIRSDMAPLAAGLGTTVAELDNFDSFECRGRNRVKGARLSEHGRANALDVRGLKLANGTTLSLTERGVARGLREKVLASVCARFTTVLGPGSDWYHEDHIHLDLAERRNNFRLCQWGVYDPLPAVAPLLPAARPDEAPPREAANEEAAPEIAAEPSQAEDAPAAASARPDRRKRR